MSDYGSLFLWHLKLEGKPIIGQNYLDRVWTKLQPFKSHRKEIVYHKRIYLGMQGSTRDGRRANECDLSVLFTIARNVCMILAHKHGRPVFGRRESFEAAIALYPGLPLSRRNYRALSDWKTVYECRVAPDKKLPPLKRVKTFMRQIKELLDYAEESI